MESPALRIASSIETATNEMFKKFSPSEQKKMLGNPYYAGFESCIVGALSQRVDTLLHIVCDLAEEYSEKCVTAFNKMRKMRSDIKNRCVALAFADDETHAGLQIADLIASCARAEILEKLGIRPAAPIVRETIDAFNTQGHTESTVIYRMEGQGIGDAELVK
jgi:hypothetical protein